MRNIIFVNALDPNRNEKYNTDGYVTWDVINFYVLKFQSNYDEQLTEECCVLETMNAGNHRILVTALNIY